MKVTGRTGLTLSGTAQDNELVYYPVELGQSFDFPGDKHFFIESLLTLN